MSVRFKWDGANLEAAARKAADDVVEEMALVLLNDIKLMLSKRGRGRLYRRSKGYGKRRNARERGFHRASKPGDPPAVDTGLLRKSWAKRKGVGPNPSRIVGSKLPYAAPLEFGTRTIEARPYIRPSLEMLKKKVGPIVDRHFRAAASRLNA